MTAAPLRAAAAALALMLTGCASSQGSEQPSAPVVSGQSAYHGTTVGDTYPLPGQTYERADGTEFVPAADSAGPVTLVFLGYTSCPDICNVVLANLASALRGSSADVREAVEVLFVSTDPARDSGPVIEEYLERFDPDFVGLRAPVETVAATAEDLHLSYEPPPTDAEGAYEVEHGTYTTAFVDGGAVLAWSAETSVGHLREDIARLVRKAS